MSPNARPTPPMPVMGSGSASAPAYPAPKNTQTLEPPQPIVLLANANRQAWESADFPVICAKCLGDNPYIRMTKESYGKECKTCVRPYTVFRWQPGSVGRFKSTEICQTCAKLKNACQSCILDLEYGLPTQIRDAALGLAENAPTSDVNKEYQQQNLVRELAESDGVTPIGELGRQAKSHDLLSKLARVTPYQKRSKAHICSFWVQGSCLRGDECPYRHEMPTVPNDPTAKQNLAGSTVPLTEKMMRRLEGLQVLQPPPDKSITHLYVGGVLEDHCSEEQLSEYFREFGELRQVRMIPKQKAAFVYFTTRASAENAAKAAFNSLTINGRQLKIMWGRSVNAGRATNADLADAATSAVAAAGDSGGFYGPPPGAVGCDPPGFAGLPPSIAPPPGMAAGVVAGMPFGGGMVLMMPPPPPMARVPAAQGAPPLHAPILYPSMDPQQMGTRNAAASAASGWAGTPRHS